LIYTISPSVRINLDHVVRLELNSHAPRLHFYLSDGSKANKDFANDQLAQDEMNNVTAQIEGVA
jgi:hypothetical protein